MGENDKQIVNFDRICRLCLHEKRTLTEIFESTADNNNLSIDQKIMTCATIDVSTRLKLINWNRFKYTAKS